MSDLTKFPYLLPAKYPFLNLSSGIYTEVSTILVPMPHSQPYVTRIGFLPPDNTVDPRLSEPPWSQKTIKTFG